MEFPPEPTGPSHARAGLWLLALALFLVLLETSLLPRTRWVEDEGWNSDVSATWMREGRIRMSSFPTDWSSKVDTRPPLVPLTIGTSFRLFGVGPVQARLASMLAALGTVVAVYFIGSLAGGPLLGGLAAVCTGADNYLVLAGRTARPEAHTMFFCALALLCYCLAPRIGGWKAGLLAGLSAGVAMNYHPTALGFALGLGLMALAQHGLGLLRQALGWAMALGFAAAQAPFAWWVLSSPVHREGFQLTWMSRASASYAEKLALELPRYVDFIGLTPKAGLPVPLPLRLHIALAIAAALVLLWRTQRRQAAGWLALLAGNALWWSFLVNKTSRAFAVTAPVFGLVVAAALYYWRPWQWRRAAAVLALYAGSQIAGNAFLIYRFRQADYGAVTRQLRELIPAGASVYGITTFYTALHDHPYYSYDRTAFPYAVEHLRPRYLILYDRVMMSGSAPGDDSFVELRNQATAFVARHGTLAGKIANPFYGELHVYRVDYPAGTPAR